MVGRERVSCFSLQFACTRYFVHEKKRKRKTYMALPRNMICKKGWKKVKELRENKRVKMCKLGILKRGGIKNLNKKFEQNLIPFIYLFLPFFFRIPKFDHYSTIKTRTNIYYYKNFSTIFFHIIVF